MNKDSSKVGWLIRNYTTVIQDPYANLYGNSVENVKAVEPVNSWANFY